MALFGRKHPIEIDDPPGVTLRPGDEAGVSVAQLSGWWRLGAGPLGQRDLFDALDLGQTRRLVLRGDALARWDSSLLVFVRQVQDACRAHAIEVDLSGLSSGLRGLLDMAAAPLESPPAAHHETGLFASAGRLALTLCRVSGDMFGFVGEVTLSMLRLVTGRAKMRGRDFVDALYQCGPESLGIVAMISLLVGLVMAFIGAAQLRIFGAQILVANMVVISMFREMGPVMAGIILTGRVGASYAATLGVMQVNEETDALITLGTDPVDFLVLPRVLAMAIMTPLLVLYANLMGLLGGAAVGVFMLDLSLLEYYNQTVKSMHNLQNLYIGLIKGLVFGILIAMSGCRCGLRCGRSSEAVGEATTSAVVAGIVYIVVADSVIAVICQLLKS